MDGGGAPELGGGPSQKVNEVHIVVLKVENLPSQFRSFAVDDRGAVSPNPVDHAFRYKMTCQLPEPPPPEALTPADNQPAGKDQTTPGGDGGPPSSSTPVPAAPTADGSPSPVTLKTIHTFVGGQYRPLQSPELLQIEAQRAQYLGGCVGVDPAAAPVVAEGGTGEEAKDRSGSVMTPTPGSGQDGDGEAPRVPYSITWFCAPPTEKEEDELRHQFEKKEKSRSRRKPAREDEEERRRKEEGETQQKNRELEELERSVMGVMGEDAPPVAPVLPPNVGSLEASPWCCQRLEIMAQQRVPLKLICRRVLRSSIQSEGLTDANHLRYQAEVSLSLEPFLEPGVCSHEYIVPFEPITIPPGGIPCAQPTTVGKKAEQKKAGKQKASKRRTDVLGTLAVEEDSTGPHPYTEAGSRVTIILRLARPLVPRPEHRPRPNLKPKDIIPLRIRRRNPPDSTKAYASEVRDIVHSLVGEFRARAEEEGGDPPTDPVEFMKALQTKGLAHAYRDKLKHSVTNIVKERFKQQPRASAEAMEHFYNELYVYLLDQLHTAVKEIFSPQPEVAVVETSLNDVLTVVPGGENKELCGREKWKRLAEEAEEVKEFAMAARYHQERLVCATDAVHPGVTSARPPSNPALLDHETTSNDDTSTGPSSRPRASPDVWYEYGEFCLRVRDSAKAEQAFKEALRVDTSHQPTLIAYGLLLLSQGQMPGSEVFLQSAVDVDVENPVAWASLALYMEVVSEKEADPYRQRERQKESRFSYNQARRLLDQHGATTAAAEYSNSPFWRPSKTATPRSNAPSATPPPSATPATQGGGGEDGSGGLGGGGGGGGVPAFRSSAAAVHMMLARFCLSLRFDGLAERCLADEVRDCDVGDGESPCVHANLLYGRMYFQRGGGRDPLAVEVLQRVVSTEADNLQAWVLLGDAYHGLGEVVEAEKAYQKAVELDQARAPATPGKNDEVGGVSPRNEPDEGRSRGAVYVRLGNIQLQLQKYAEAQRSYMQGARVWPCGLTWRGVGEAYYRLEEFEAAEQALNEANIVNHVNPLTWAYMCLLCIKTNRFEEADDAFQRALALNLSTADLITEIAIALQGAGRMRLAEAAYRRALKEEDSPFGRMMLADVLMHLELYAEARVEYQRLDGMVDATEEERSHAAQRLQIIADRLGEL